MRPVELTGGPYDGVRFDDLRLQEDDVVLMNQEARYVVTDEIRGNYAVAVYDEMDPRLSRAAQLAETASLT